MSDNRSFPDITFVNADSDQLITNMIAVYETMTSKKIYPASPERLFVLWAADIIVQLMVMINWSAKQNVPRFAEGAYLDSLAEIFRDVQRLPATAATTTMRLYISEALLSDTTIPAGTRITVDGQLTFATDEAAVIQAGSLSVDVSATCQTVGAVGNGFVPGQISTLVDVFPYYDHCENITTSTGGTEAEDDANFYSRLRDSEDTYSTAGSIGAYKYYAKSANQSIADVAVISPSDGAVDVYVLLQGGAIPDAGTLAEIQAALSAGDVRPLTDSVTVKAPLTASYDINITYYIPQGSSSSMADIEAAVQAAVENYNRWQSAKMGRDINPSKLISMLMETGIKRVAVTTPVFGAVAENEVAIAQTVSIINGGYEGE